MGNLNDHHLSVTWENVNLKVPIGSLLFDILLDRTFEQRTFGPGQPVKTAQKHSHGTYEVHFIVSGSGSLAIHDHNVEVRESTIHIIGPHIFHAFSQNQHDPITRFTFRFTCQESLTYEPWFPQTENEQIKNTLNGLTHCCLPDPNHKIILLMEEIKNHLEHPSFGAYASAQSLMAYTLMQIIRLLPRSDRKYTLPSKLKDEQRFPIVDNFFSRGYNKHLTVEMLAAQLNLSIRQVHRLLRKHYHSSFKQKLIHTRIEVAKNLLKNSKLPVHKIAEEVHYTESYFRQLFKAETGYTPTQYRSTQHPE